MNKFEALLLGMVTITQWALLWRLGHQAREVVLISSESVSAPPAQQMRLSSALTSGRRLIVKVDNKTSEVVSAQEVGHG